MAVHSGYPLVCAWLQKLAGDNLLDSQDNAVLAPNTYGGSAVLDSFDSIFDLRLSVSYGLALTRRQKPQYLEISAIWRED
jgi:hypothetical protein